LKERTTTEAFGLLFRRYSRALPKSFLPAAYFTGQSDLRLLCAQEVFEILKIPGGTGPLNRGAKRLSAVG
jgi:hypothetical protein